jgi:hypothetical protein
MNDAIDFADGKFRIECHDMLLTRAGGPPLEVRGSGEIWQDEKARLQFKIFADSAAFNACRGHIYHLREPGRLIPDSDYFNLEAEELSGGIWRAERIFPSTRGGGMNGVVHGDVPQLQKTTTIPGFSRTGETIKVRFRGKIQFPCNNGTETVTHVGGAQVRSTSSLDAGIIEDGPARFVTRIESDHTSVDVRFSEAGLHEKTAYRIHESLQFVLGKELTIMAVETKRGIEETIQLVSPWPLQYNHSNADAVWVMFRDYFRYVHADSSHTWHPISDHIGRVIESGATSLDTEILALGVGTEGLAGQCFLHLVPIHADFLTDLLKIENSLADLEVDEGSRGRVAGAIGAMRSPRNSDAIYAFVEQHHLPCVLFTSWKKIRNNSAHGNTIPGTQLSKLMQRRSYVYCLLYSMALSAIGYHGPHTRYDIFRWPAQDWPPPGPPPSTTSAEA